MRRIAIAFGIVLALVGETLAAPGAASPPDRPRGTYKVVHSGPGTPRFGPGPQHRIIYMNGEGGTFYSGDDDSSENRSSIPYGTSEVDPFYEGDAAWAEVMACVRDLFSRFDVEVTDVDPGDVPHIESVVGGFPGQVGMGQGVGGVAPMEYDCSVVERAIVFTFAGVYGDDLRGICETVGQEVSHALGLDHEYLCEDPMTYLYGCGDKEFRDVDAPCGEYNERECMCGGSTQNSVRLFLDEILGPADAEPPFADLTEPADGATVEPGFAIRGTASDNKAVTALDVLIDGAVVAQLTAPPFAADLTAPATLADGPHTIEMVARDAAGNQSTDEVTIEQAAAGPGDPPDDPPDDPMDPPDPGDPTDPDPPALIGGCGCNAALPAEAAPVGVFMLLGLLLFARRRR